jgi:sugar transferase (PEP-CTERM/EpsH1 system associated)
VDAVFAGRLARVPQVIHGEHGRDWKDTAGRNWKRNQIRRLIGRLVDRYVVVCKFFGDWLREDCKVPAHKILHVPNGVDTARFKPLADLKSQIVRPRLTTEVSNNLQSEICNLRSQLGLPVGGILLGTVGRLDPVKDMATLLKGFAVVRHRVRDVNLAIVGDGPMRSQLVHLARHLNIEPNVCWLGEREDVPLLLRCFDLFVQTSLFEGMSNTILEAMATGLPVVATDTGGNGELIASDENGALIPVGEIEALVHALTRYVETPDLRRLHGSQSRQRALREFDLSLMASRYADLYERVVR